MPSNLDSRGADATAGASYEEPRSRALFQRTESEVCGEGHHGQGGCLGERNAGGSLDNRTRPHFDVLRSGHQLLNWEPSQSTPHGETRPRAVPTRPCGHDMSAHVEAGADGWSLERSQLASAGFEVEGIDGRGDHPDQCTVSAGRLEGNVTDLQDRGVAERVGLRGPHGCRDLIPHGHSPPVWLPASTPSRITSSPSATQ